MSTTYKLSIDVPQNEQLTGTAPGEVQELSRAPAQTPPGAATTSKFIGVESVLALVTIPWLVRRLTDWVVNSKSPGVIVDMRKTPPSVTRPPGIEHGILVVIDASGASQVHNPKDAGAVDDILGKLAPLLGK